MSNRLPSLFVLVPGPWRDPAEVVDVLTTQGIRALHGDTSLQLGAVRVELVEDERLDAGFTWGRSGAFPDELQVRVRELGRAALLECAIPLDESPQSVAALGRVLRSAGGVAIRMEASGAATTWEPWLADLESGNVFRVYQSTVLIVEDDGGLMFTCGMHQFGLPDVQVELDAPTEGVMWLDAFCAFQLLERPTLHSGHTFSPHGEVARLSIERWPDHRHHATDGRHNPFGVWRLQEPAVARVKASTPVLAFVPPLMAVLLAAERGSERPLVRAQADRGTAGVPRAGSARLS